MQPGYFKPSMMKFHQRLHIQMDTSKTQNKSIKLLPNPNTKFRTTENVGGFCARSQIKSLFQYCKVEQQRNKNGNCVISST